MTPKDEHPAGIPSAARLRRRLAAGDVLVGTFLGLGNPTAAEICSQALSWVLVDLEHGAATETDLVPLLQAVDCGGAACLVRVAGIDSPAVGRALDAGAAGIMFPRVGSAAQARAAVAATRHPPEGSRGVARLVRSHAYGRRQGNDAAPVVAAQIESASGVDAAREIAATPGVDIAFVGPADLGQDLGMARPALDPVIEGVIEAAIAGGAHAGLMTFDADDIPRWTRHGASFVAVGSDVGLLALATDRLRSAVADMTAAAALPT